MGEAEGKMRALYVEERRAEILRVIEEKKNISVKQICETFGVSAVTARGDLERLENLGKLRRVHGGAFSIDHTLVSLELDKRMSINSEGKKEIAKLANGLVCEGDSLLVDAGTTTLEFVKTLSNKRNITIVTHDLPVANYADVSLPNASVVVVGGALRDNHHDCYGSITVSVINQLYVDKAFLGANSFSPEQGFMTESLFAEEVKHALLAHAKEKIVLIDSSKLGHHNFKKFADVNDFDYVVMDKDVDGRMGEAIRTRGCRTQLMTAENESDS